MLSKVSDYILDVWPLDRLWRLHGGDFKACCYHSSIPVRLDAKRILVDHGIRVALGCRQIPGPVDHGGFNPPIDRRPPR